LAKLIPYNVSGVEEGGGGTGVKVKPGVKPCRIVRCIQRTEKRDGTPANDLEVALDFGAEFDWVFTYIPLGEAGEWKLAEFIRALGLKEEGKLNPDKIQGTVIRCKINTGTYNDEYSPDAGRLMKAQPGDEELIGESVSEMSNNGGGPEPDAEPEASAAAPEYADGFMPSREGEEGIGSYDDWPDEDLTAEAEDRGLTLPGGRGSARDKAIKALRDEDSAVMDGGEETAAVAEPEAETPEDDYDEWDLDRLKKEWEDRNLGDLPAIRGRGAAERLVAAIVEELRKDDAENPFEA